MWHLEICYNPVADEIRKRLLTFRIHSVIFISISLEDESNLFPGYVSLKAGNRLIMVSLISQSYNIILRKFRFINITSLGTIQTLDGHTMVIFLTNCSKVIHCIL